MRRKSPCLPLWLGLVGVAAIGVAPALAATDSLHEEGQASYYGNHWNGHRTSSGARFDQRKLTAASADLPLGTRILVTSQNTGDTVVVTVNDRQPDHGDRILDLSRAAARRLHMLGSGVADVAIAAATENDIRNEAALDGETMNEVADAPDEDADQEVADGQATPRVSHARHGPRHRHLARR